MQNIIILKLSFMQHKMSYFFLLILWWNVIWVWFGGTDADGDVYVVLFVREQTCV